MAAQRSRLSLQDKTIPENDRLPRLHLPLIPTLIGALALVNVVSVVMALIE